MIPTHPMVIVMNIDQRRPFIGHFMQRGDLAFRQLFVRLSPSVCNICCRSVACQDEPQ